MKILDVRGNLVKIESSKPVHISSLLKVTDGEDIYIAQVLYVESGNTSHVIFAKFLAYYDAPFVPVNIQNVSQNAVCEVIDVTAFTSNLGHASDIVLGELAYEQNMLTADKEFFDKKILVVSEKDVDANLLISNFSHQIKNLGYNTLVFDTVGTMEGVKLVAGEDFRLPLNEHAIGFIFDKYFSDITEESRAMVSSIFTELKGYASTVPYIPFKSFKSVIDSVFNYSQNLSLYFFKTKLEKLCEADVFANSHEEVMDWKSLSEYGPGTVIIDLSRVDRLFVREYISLVLNEFKNSDNKLYAFAKLSDNISDKDFIREIIENNNVITSCIVPSDFRFISALKQNSGSIIVFGGVKKPDNFDYCKFILKNLSSDKYVLTGNIAAPYSFVFQLKEISEVVPKAEDIEIEQNNIEEFEKIEPSVKEQQLDEQARSEAGVQNVNDGIALTEEMPDTIKDSSAVPQDEYEKLPELDDEPEEEARGIEDYIPVSANEEIEASNNSSGELVAETNAIPEADFDKPVEGIEEIAELREVEERNEQASNEYEPVAISEEEVIVEDEIPELIDGKTEIPDENIDTENNIVYSEENIENSEDMSITAGNQEIINPENIIPEADTAELPVLNEELSEGIQQPESILDEDNFDNQEIVEISGEIPELDSQEELSDLDLTLDEAELQDATLDIADNIPELDAVPEDNGELELKFEDDTLNSELDNVSSNEMPPPLQEHDTDVEQTESEKTPEELLDEEIRRDVDKVYMAPQHETSDELSEDDLDFIEELVGTDDLVIEEPDEASSLEVVAEEPIVQHSDLLPDEEEEQIPIDAIKQDDDGAILQQRNTAAPAVPIYAAEIPEDAIVHSDPIQQGDRVMHVKFGVGVVEKIFSYGTKNFCSINFENIGRKVLDPNITELKKV